MTMLCALRQFEKQFQEITQKAGEASDAYPPKQIFGCVRNPCGDDRVHAADEPVVGMDENDKVFEESQGWEEYRCQTPPGKQDIDSIGVNP